MATTHFNISADSNLSSQALAVLEELGIDMTTSCE